MKLTFPLKPGPGRDFVPKSLITVGVKNTSGSVFIEELPNGEFFDTLQEAKVLNE